MDPTAPAAAAQTSSARTDAIETAMTTQANDTQWFIARDGKQYGPLSDQEMQKLVELGHLKPADLVWRPGFADWRPAGSLMPQAKPAPAPMPAPTPAAAAAPAASHAAAPQATTQQPRQQQQPSAPSPAQAQPHIAPTHAAQTHISQSAAAAAAHRTDPMTSGRTAQTGGRPAHAADAPAASDPRRAMQHTAGAPHAGPGTGPNTGPHTGPGQPMGAHPMGAQPQPTTGLPAMGGVTPTQAQPQHLPHMQPQAYGQPAGQQRPYGGASQPQSGHATQPGHTAQSGHLGALPQAAAAHQAQQPAAVTGGATAGRGARLPEPAERKLPDIAEESAAPQRGRKRTMAAAAIVLLVAAGSGLLLSKKGTLPNIATVSSDGPTPNARVAPLGGLADNTDAIDANFQRTQLWILVKKEFPDWYGERLKEVAKLNAEKQSEDAVAKRLTEALVALRRQHADKALAASTPKLKDVANAFLGNLKALAAKSTEACYNFISQGETSPAVIEMMRSPDQNSAVQAQVAAIFEAIAEGRKTPTTHSAPVKTDYDALADQLTKLGWTQADLQLFADSKSLARAKPEKVCKMVQDWFVAHIGIQDAAVQERLLVETLRPVVAG